MTNESSIDDDYNYEDELKKRFANRLHICTRSPCYEGRENGSANNRDLEEVLNHECGGTDEEKMHPVHGKNIEIAGRKFRIECDGCLGACSVAPIVEIIVEGQKPAPAKVTSIDSLREQVQQVIEGTWDYPGWPE